MTDKRKDCPMRHENGNCIVSGGFCTAVNDPICEALHNAFDCGYRSALRQQDVPDKDVGKNEPLTMAELRKMDGEPVWVVWPDGRIKPQWFIVGSAFWIDMFVEWDGKISLDYGKIWLAYRQKPEEGKV